ncbi:MAG: hypothetical protein ABI861_04000 [Panacibacter sp.]
MNDKNYYIASLDSNFIQMDDDFRDRSRKNYNTMRNVYNVTIGILIIGIGLLMFFNDAAGLNLFQQFDKTMIYAFGGICILYGGFRLYRGLKKEE